MASAPQPGKAIKVFYSYAHKDETFREDLENHLALLQHRGIISGWHNRNITAGANWEQEIDGHLNTAQLILFLISADFLASAYCYGKEMKRALERQASEEAWVVPILVRSVSWEDAPFNHLQVLPRNGVPIQSSTWLKDEAWTQVVKELRKVIAEIRVHEPDEEATEDRPPPSYIFDVPHPRNPFFTGREAILQRLHASFASGNSVAFTQSIGGLGGIGKTQIAIEYAYRYRQQYHHLFWINADSSESLQAGFMNIASLLHLPLPAEDIDIVVTMHALRKWFSHNEHWLLVLDNADDLDLLSSYSSLLHTERGHILITTRASATGGLTARTTSIEPMESDDAALLLLRRAKVLTSDATLEQASDRMRKDAEAIVTILDGLPLALDQAGAYLEETGSSLANYVSLYQQRQRDLLNERGRFAPGHPQPVATTWSLSFQIVEQTNHAAAELLRMCAFLQPDAVPIQMLINGHSYLGPILEPVAGDLFTLDRAIGELLKFSLVKRSPDRQHLQLHRLVQVVLQETMDLRTRKAWIERVILMLETTCRRLKPEIWEQCWPYVLQAQNLFVLTAKYNLISAELAYVFMTAGDYLFQYFYYKEAQPLYEQALRIREQVLGNEHADTATSLHSLAILYQDQGKYEEAQPLYERALHIQEQVLGTEHTNTVNTLNNLANLYRNQGKYAEAEPLYQRALHLYEQILGARHANTASTLNDLALLYRSQSKYEEAEPLYERALHIREQVLGPAHPDTASSLNNLAFLYHNQGKYGKAKPLYERALHIREQVLGTDHPATANSLNNLASLYRTRGKYTEAEPLYQRALHIREQVLGPDHPTTASSFNNLALLYESQGKYGEAETLYKRALHIREQMLGPEHPDIASSLNNLAGLYLSQDKYEEAEPLYERALHIREQVLGPAHPDTASTLNNLANLYRNQGKHTAAEPLYKHALHIREQVLGNDHPVIASSLNNLAKLYQDQNKYQEAESLYKRALHIREQVLGPTHPDTASSLNNLAGLYRNQGRYEEAKPLYGRALRIREQVLGPRHPDTARSLNNLAGLYQDQEKYAEAVLLYERALYIHEQVLGAEHPTTKAVKEYYQMVTQKLSGTEQHRDT